MQAAHDRGERSLALAYRYLNRRDRSASEVRNHLEQNGVQATEIDTVLRVLSDQGYLDDNRFARVFVEDKRRLEGWGNERIRGALHARGIRPDLIDETLCGEPRELELARALALLASRFPAPPHTRRDRDRALGVMLRKGYDFELALDALRAHAGAISD